MGILFTGYDQVPDAEGLDRYQVKLTQNVIPSEVEESPTKQGDPSPGSSPWSRMTAIVNDST